MESIDIENLREKISIIDVVEWFSYVKLERSCKQYKACCPFHHEKTPSFFIDNDKNLYHCFGCGAGGDAFSFVMNINNISFIESAKEIALRYGYNLFLSETEKKRQHIISYFEKLSKRSIINLKNNISILKDRNINEDNIDYYEIGLCLENIPDDICKDANFKPFFFKDRAIFPIKDTSGRITGFTGRTTGEDKRKYIHSTNSIVFDKKKSLFNLYNAINHIEDDTIFIVEGVFDVISLSKIGIYNSVAILGSTLTKEQLEILSKYAKKFILCFDNDLAGRNATMKAIELILTNNFECDVILFDSRYKDIDDYISNVEKRTVKKINSIRYYLQVSKDMYKNTDIYINNMISFLKSIPPVQGQKGLEILSIVTKVEKSILLNSFNKNETIKNQNNNKNSNNDNLIYKEIQQILLLYRDDLYPVFDSLPAFLRKDKIISSILDGEDVEIQSFDKHLIGVIDPMQLLINRLEAIKLDDIHNKIDNLQKEIASSNVDKKNLLMNLMSLTKKRDAILHKDYCYKYNPEDNIKNVVRIFGGVVINFK